MHDEAKQPGEGVRISPRDVRLSIEHSAIYPLSECLRLLKAQRASLAPGNDPLPLNIGILILSCAFVEASLSRGLVHAANYWLFDPTAPTLGSEERQRIETAKEELVTGEIFGNPLNPVGPRPTYAGASNAILSFLPTDSQVVPQTAQDGLRTLFQIRNILIHGQAFLASGFFSGNLAEPVFGYEGSAEKKHSGVIAYLTKVGVWDPKQLAGNLAFPYASHEIVDHLLLQAVEFLRAMCAGIKDQKLKHAFGAGCPQYLFPIFAGEAVEVATRVIPLGSP